NESESLVGKAGIPDPAPGDCSEAENPVVELPERPALRANEAAVQFFDFKTPEQIAHRHRRSRRVPVDVATGPGRSEPDPLDKKAACAGKSELAGVKTAIDHDPVSAPEGVRKLHQPRVRSVVNAVIDAHFFAPEGPALVENGMAAHPPQPALV